MTKKTLGYPYSYENELNPEITYNNRKQAVLYLVLIFSFWWCNVRFLEPIQSYPSFSNKPKI